MQSKVKRRTEVGQFQGQIHGPEKGFNLKKRFIDKEPVGVQTK